MATGPEMHNPQYDFEGTFRKALTDPVFQQLLVKDLWGTLASEGFNIEAVPPDIRESISYGVTRQLILTSSPCGGCSVCTMCYTCPGIDLGSALAGAVGVWGIPVF